MPTQSVLDAYEMIQTAFAELRRANTLMDIAMALSDGPVFELDPEGRIRYANRAAMATLNCAFQDLEGQAMADLLEDELMTQRRIAELVNQGHQQSWPTALRLHTEPNRYIAIGIALPTSEQQNQPRVIIWCRPIDPALPNESALEPNLPNVAPNLTPEPVGPILNPGQAIRGRDLTQLIQHFGCTVLQMCKQMGISPITWYKWVNRRETPIPNRTAELHLRLLDAVPKMINRPPSPIDIHQELSAKLGQRFKHTDFALMLGLEPHSGKRWQDGEQTSDAVLALCSSLKRLINEMPPGYWDRYRQIIDQQAALEGVDLWKERSWQSGKVAKRKSRAKPPKK